jgi:hypothetical protein
LKTRSSGQDQGCREIKEHENKIASAQPFLFFTVIKNKIVGKTVVLKPEQEIQNESPRPIQENYIKFNLV